jgi:redox-sensitive bicupin YhaK (pirin superfamily)
VRADDAETATPKEHLIVFDPAEPARLTAVGAAAHVVLLGGPPLDAPRFLWWNFVSSERDLILQAQAAWSQQRFPQVPGETEYIPLPSRPLPPAPTAL